METLSNHEIISLNRAIADLYAIEKTDNFQRSAMATFRKVVSFDRVSYNKVDNNKRPLVITVETKEHLIEAKRYEEVLQCHISDHPFWDFKSGVKLLSEIVDPKSFKKMPLYNDYYKKLGTESQIICGHSNSQNEVEAYALSRGRHDFSAKDKTMLELLNLHLSNSQVVYFEKMRFNDELLLLQSFTDAEEQPTILINKQGRIKWESRRARFLLSEYLGRPAKNNGKLPPRIYEWVRREINSYQMFHERKPLKINVPACVAGEGRRCIIINLLYGGHLGSGFGSFILTIKEEQPSAPETYRLTQREAEILQWLAEGKSNGTIAIILAISIRTVEKHLEHIFEKLGVETRVSAAKKFMKA